MKNILTLFIFIHLTSFGQDVIPLTKYGAEKELYGDHHFWNFSYLKVKSIEEIIHTPATDSTQENNDLSLVLVFDTLGRVKTKHYQFHYYNKARVKRNSPNWRPSFSTPNTKDSTDGIYTFITGKDTTTYATDRLVYYYPNNYTTTTLDLHAELFPTPGVLDGIYIRPDSLLKTTILVKTDTRGKPISKTVYQNDKLLHQEKIVYENYNNKGESATFISKIECTDRDGKYYEIRFRYTFY
ncbi:hypothetical protein K6119_09620 [Paracrocinitomix mangrovi]|uniref:hypothetical protein n=1 Tax=Paracrocinitomix mangrovi TaxID=2862509 RepID=UPI001C8E8C80|nr:hypothetical protein [Paracrocinitomix mangrovi]UKN03749.1 hypothetical protein K6119_09620 [Paracrocinitomix mangrovi]